MNTIATSALRVGEVGCVLAHVKGIRSAYLDLIRREKEGTTSLHFQQCALIFEDDVSLEYVSKWGDGNGLNDLLDEMAMTDPDWSVIQLSYILGLLDGKEILTKNYDMYHKGKKVRTRDPFEDMDAFGTAAYVISKKGMEEILSKCWPNGLNGPSWNAIVSTTKQECDITARSSFAFDLRNEMGSTSDVFIYTACTKPYLATRPLFTYNDQCESQLGSNEDQASASKQLVHHVFYNANGSQPRDTFDGWWYAVGKAVLYRDYYPAGEASGEASGEGGERGEAGGKGGEVQPSSFSDWLGCCGGNRTPETGKTKTKTIKNL